MMNKHKNQNNNLAIRFNNIKVFVNRSITFELSPVIYQFAKENPSLIYQIETPYDKQYIHLFCDIFRGKSFQITIKNLQFLIDIFQELQVSRYDFLLGKMQETVINSIDSSIEYQDLLTFYKLIQNLNDDNFLDTISKCEELINVKIDPSSVANLLFNLFITKPHSIDLYLRFTLEFNVILKDILLRQLYLLLSISSSCDIIYIAAKFIEYQIINSREVLLILKMHNKNFYQNLLSFILSPKKHYFRLKSRDELRDLCLKGESQIQLIKIIQNDNISEFQLLVSDPNFDIDNTQLFTNRSLYFEKIRMLHKKNLCCIEVSAFFGSIQIFKFLLMSNARTTDRLAKFAIAGGNIEIIHLCDQKKCNFSKCLKYALKYDHHELFEWLIDSKGCKLFDDKMPIKDKMNAFLEKPFFTVIPSPEIFQSMIKRFMNDEIIAILIASIHRGFYTYVSIIAKIINCIDTKRIQVDCNLFSTAIKCGSIETYRLIKSNADLRNFIKKISLKTNLNYSFNFCTSEYNIYKLKVCNKSQRKTNFDDNIERITQNEYKIPCYVSQTNYEQYNSNEDYNENINNDNENDNDNSENNKNEKTMNDNDNDNSENNENTNDNDNENTNDNDNENTNDNDNENTNDNDNENTNDNDNENTNDNEYDDFGEEEEEEEDRSEYDQPPTSVTFNDFTDLHIACFSGNSEAVDDIIYKNLDKNLAKLVNSYPTNYTVHDFNDYGIHFFCTPLHAATLSKSFDSVFLLLATNECDLNAFGNKNMTPLHHSVLNDCVDIFQLIYNWPGVNQKPTMFRQKLPFHLAAKYGSINVLKYIVEKTKNFDVNETAAQGMTALHYACKYNQKEIVSYLLQIPECNVNLKTEDNKFTALHFACQNSDIEIVKNLIDRKDLKLNERNLDDETPLVLAVRSKFVDIVSFLINLEGIDLNVPSLLLAACMPPDSLINESIDQINCEIVKILLTKKEINVNSRTKDKKLTPLHIAALNNNFETVKVLMRSEKIIRKPHDIFKFLVIHALFLFSIYL